MKYLNKSVLQNASRAQINYNPFPHIIIKNCLSEEYYKLLEEAYVEDDQLINSHSMQSKQNVRVKFTFDEIVSERIKWPRSEIWSEFVRYHTSENFFKELLQLFGPEIKTLSPHLESKLETTLEQVPVTVHLPNVKYSYEESKKIFLDGDVGINTISNYTSSVRNDHVDGMQKLFGGILYFRRKDDHTTGGDLDLSRWKYDQLLTIDKSTELRKDQIEFVTKIKYEPNTAIFWVNSPGAIHGVTPRGPSKVSRRLVYFAGRVDDKTLFTKGLFPHAWPEPRNLMWRIWNYFIRKLEKRFK